jgi:hypothetical protein
MRHQADVNASVNRTQELIVARVVCSVNEELSLGQLEAKVVSEFVVKLWEQNVFFNLIGLVP